MAKKDRDGRNGGRLNSGYEVKPKNIGRPRKLLSELIQEWKDEGHERATQSQVQEVFEYLLGMPLHLVKEIADDVPDADALVALMEKAQAEGVEISESLARSMCDVSPIPSIVRKVARVISNGGFDAIETLLSRAHGKPKQLLEHTGGDGEPLSAYPTHVTFEVKTPTPISK